MLTRQTHERTFRLRPCERTNRLYLYCLALAAQKTGVAIHAVCAMSDHHHVAATDVNGNLPIFSRELHRTLANALNATQGLSDSVWSGGKTNYLEAAEPEDLLRKIAYVAVNPVRAGLVETPEDWPGVVLWGEHRIIVERPDEYFHPKGKAPKTIELVISRPAAALEQPDWDERLAAEIERQMADARRGLDAKGTTVLGKAAVLATPFTARAKSWQVKGARVPTVAAWSREARGAVLRAHRAFRADYAAALAAWTSGDRTVVFPPGTWWMRVHHGVRVYDVSMAA